MDQKIREIANFAYKTHLIKLISYIGIFLVFIPIIGWITALLGVIGVLVGGIMTLIYLYKFSKHFNDKKIFIFPILGIVVLIVGSILAVILGVSSAVEMAKMSGGNNLGVLIMSLVGGSILFILTIVAIFIIFLVLWAIAYFKLAKRLNEMKIFWAYIVGIVIILFSFIPFIGTLLPIIPEIIWLLSFKKIKEGQ